MWQPPKYGCQFDLFMGISYEDCSIWGPEDGKIFLTEMEKQIFAPFGDSIIFFLRIRTEMEII
jgi:hypothetical protein